MMKIRGLRGRLFMHVLEHGILNRPSISLLVLHGTTTLSNLCQPDKCKVSLRYRSAAMSYYYSYLLDTSQITRW